MLLKGMVTNAVKRKLVNYCPYYMALRVRMEA